MDFKNFDLKKLPILINSLGVIVMLLWGTLGNDWEHSWIAVAVSGVLSGAIYAISGSAKKKE